MDGINRLPEIRMIGVPSALGVPDSGAQGGPAALLALGILDAVRRAGLAAHWEAMLQPSTGERWPVLVDLCRRLADVTALVIARAGLPVVLGGDHSIAAGTWRGVARALNKPLGLVWIDAHLDAHTRKTSVSGNPHGMPLAALLGADVGGLETVGGPVLDPKRVALVGAHSWESGELQLLQSAGVRIFRMDEIRQRGLAAVMGEAFAIAQGVVRQASRNEPGLGCFGVSLDVDGIDPSQAPGVTTPVPGGLDAGQLLQCLRGLVRHPNFVALEIAEYSPGNDVAHSTGRLVVNLVEAMCMP
jgi:ornithine--oxo-acid transaminase